MKLIGMKFKITMIAMAVVCLLMAPAFSVPSDRAAAKDKQDGKLYSMANITPEQMGNMTLGEIREMRQQAWGNSTACTPERQDKTAAKWEIIEVIRQNERRMPARMRPIISGTLTDQDPSDQTTDQMPMDSSF